jgi:cell wall-associated NlpC family hydrolase
MHLSFRLLLIVLFAASTGPPLLAATKSQQKKTAKPVAAAKKTTSADKDAPVKKKPAPAEDDEAAEKAPVMTPAAVSTISIEDIRDFDQYPKQIQSLVQSSLALTHLELGYLYGSDEPNKGGMDCSGTIYHILQFQGLKNVPRQSDEMCQWVEKKTQLHLTPAATSFDSEEFAALKPGDLLFWTNTTATTRKLPVTHVMVYLGKLKKSGKRIVFGSSDGRSFEGHRRSGVSVFDFSLPRAESTSHFYGYGAAPGLMPFVPEPTVIAQTPPAPKETAEPKEVPAPKELPAAKTQMVTKETAVAKASLTAKQPLAPKETPVPKVSLTAQASPALKETVMLKEAPTAKALPAPKEEVRKAVAADAGSKSEPEAKKTAVADAGSKSKTTTAAKAKSSVTKKKSNVTTSATRRRTPAAPPKSVFQQRVDHTVSSVRRFFQQ